MDKKPNRSNLKMLIAVGAMVLLLILVLIAVNGLSSPSDLGFTASSIRNTPISSGNAGLETSVPPIETPEPVPSASPVQQVTFPPTRPVEGNGTLEVHFINVGEADAILVRTGDANMLIDAGESSAGKAVAQYLQNLNIDTLEYLIATHPDQDHIGGMDTVVKRFAVRNFYMTEFVKDSKHYVNLMEALAEQNLVRTVPRPGADNDSFMLGQARCQILAPLAEYEKSGSNNSSIVIRMTFGETVFLFMGDTEKESEEDILARYPDLRADVLKVAHHGRSGSTRKDFVKRVKPSWSVIPCEKENITQSVVTRLEESGSKVYVLGRDGTIVCKTDGNTISFDP